MKKVLLVAAVLGVTALLATDLYAQGRGGAQGRNAKNRLYDPKTVETLAGEVTEVKTLAPARGKGAGGVHLLLKTDAEVISVHLGPSWFLDDQDVQIEKGDRISVKGSRITFNGKPAIIAAEIEKGDEGLILRDEDGVPVWAGQGRTSR